MNDGVRQRSRRRPAWQAALVLAVVGLTRPPGNAQAHANLVRSEPPVGGTVASAPDELVLVFSEPLDTGYTRVKLIDSQGRTVDAGPGVVDPAEPRILRLPLADLPDDSYVAEWRNRSTIDGHVRAGLLPFGVGVAADPTALLPALSAPDPLTAPPPLAEMLVRWLGFIGLVSAGGGVAFARWVWRPAYGDAASTLARAADADQAMTKVLRRLVTAGAGLVAGAAVVRLAQQAIGDAAGAGDAGIWPALAALAQSRSGALTIARIVLAAVLVGHAIRLPRAGAGPHRPWDTAAVLAAAVVITVAAGGHAAASPTRPAVSAGLDALHVAATAAWLGGLPPLAAAAWAARRGVDTALPLASLAPRFSRLALRSVLLLAATGVYAYGLQVGARDLLTTTTYGRALSVKLVLFGVLVALGAYHRLRQLPRLHRAGPSLMASFRRGVALEMVVGAIVLVAVGAMTSVAPSRDASALQARSGVLERVVLPEGDIALHVMPALVGNNAVAVDMSDTRPGAANAPAEAVLRVTPPGGVARPFDVVLESVGGSAGRERFVAHGNFFIPPGTWRAEVIVRRRGLDDVRHTFAARITRTPDERLALRVDADLEAPISSSPASIAAGAALFQTHCAPCHGPEGHGNGVAAAGLERRPADFRLHVALHSDAELYAWVALGVEDTPMPAFRDTLSREELWHVVNYLRATFDIGVGASAGG